MNIQRPRGTNDILPEETGKWQFVEAKIRELCRRYGYQEIRTPVFEHTELFVRGSAKRRILWKKRCMLSPTAAAAAWLYGLKGQPGWCGLLSSTGSMLGLCR